MARQLNSLISADVPLRNCSLTRMCNLACCSNDCCRSTMRRSWVVRMTRLWRCGTSGQDSVVVLSGTQRLTSRRSLSTDIVHCCSFSVPLWRKVRGFLTSFVLRNGLSLIHEISDEDCHAIVTSKVSKISIVSMIEHVFMWGQAIRYAKTKCYLMMCRLHWFMQYRDDTVT